MWVAVWVGLLVQQPAALLELCNDHRARGIDPEPGHQLGGRRIAPIRTHGIVDDQAIIFANREIFLAVRGCRMYGTGARLQRHVLAQYHRHVLREPRMLELQALKGRTATTAEHLAL